MAERICSIDECSEPVWIKKRGWCRTHYNRWYKYGDPCWQPERRQPPPVRPTLTCVACGSLMWQGKRSSPQGEARCRECRRERNAYRYGYTYAHRSVRKIRGSARKQSCDRCGKSAAHWAYDHQDPNELAGLSNDGRCLSTYSLDPAHYIPLCRSCHYKFDEPRREFETPDLFNKPIIEWSDDELKQGYAALGRYMQLRRRQAA